ncbi:MAG: hypothetical protein QOG87_1190 [Actinomycetota bacterium]
MRRLFTTAEVHSTKHALAWATEKKRVRSAGRGVYAVGAEPLTALDWARADVLRSGREARGNLAGVLHGLDSVGLGGRPTRRDRLPDHMVVVLGGVRCADGLTTMADLAATLDDLTWEQALESALRKTLTTVAALEGVRSTRVRRVLALRPPGAPPTESLLETLMVQLARDVPEVGELVRQHEVRDEYDQLIARLDLSRPDLGFFFELDGEQHKGQPVYDAMRQTAVVAATGWLPGRFTWTDVTRFPESTKRSLAALALRATAIRRPSP